ncbi:MAG: hypothetical protein RIQ93_1319 [Verrucomicrobiota bacterium]|jgi:drug/metabolite transporter (DMT)-like permease
MTQTAASQRTRALLMLVVATVLWGMSFPLIKAMGLLQAQLQLEGGSWFSALYLVAPRFVLALAVLTAFWGREVWRVTRQELKQGGIMGLFASAGMLLQSDGLQFTSASTSAFLTQFYAILIPIWVAWKTRHNPGWLVWVCSALVLAGVAILGQFNWGEMRFGRGEWETLLCSLFFMGQILWLEKKEFSANRPEQLTLVLFAVQAIILSSLTVVVAPTTAALLRPWHSELWVGFTVALTLLCTVAAYLLMNRWQPKITATEAGLVYCVEPIFASGFALFLPGLFSILPGVTYANEGATWTLAIGGSLITVANVLLQLQPPKKSAL